MTRSTDRPWVWWMRWTFDIYSLQQNHVFGCAPSHAANSHFDVCVRSSDATWYCRCRCRSMKREMTVEISSEGFMRTGLKSDVCQVFYAQWYYSVLSLCGTLCSAHWHHYHQMLLILLFSFWWNSFLVAGVTVFTVLRVHGGPSVYCATCTRRTVSLPCYVYTEDRQFTVLRVHGGPSVYISLTQFTEY